LNKAVEEIGTSMKQDKKDAEANKIIQGAVIPFFFGTVEATLN
jgi:hypothetical protein